MQIMGAVDINRSLSGIMRMTIKAEPAGISLPDLMQPCLWPDTSSVVTQIPQGSTAICAPCWAPTLVILELVPELGYLLLSHLDWCIRILEVVHLTLVWGQGVFHDTISALAPQVRQYQRKSPLME